MTFPDKRIAVWSFGGSGVLGVWSSGLKDAMATRGWMSEFLGRKVRMIKI